MCQPETVKTCFPHAAKPQKMNRFACHMLAGHRKDIPLGDVYTDDEQEDKQTLWLDRMSHQ